MTHRGRRDRLSGGAHVAGFPQAKQVCTRMTSSPVAPTIAHMVHPVLWSEDDGPTLAGKLELVAGVIRLEGANGDVVKLSVPLEAITAARIGRAQPERLRGRPALVLGLRSGRRIRIATLSGFGALHELADAVGAR
jgi:hypothetical protein